MKAGHGEAPAGGPAADGGGAADRHGAVLLVALSIAAALALRLIGLAGQGIANYDEAAHLLEGRFFRLAFLRHTLGRPVALEGLPLFHAKPLHAGLIALAQAVLGDHPWTGGVVSALLGAASVALVCSLGRRLWGRMPGALAAATLAAMPWSVLYGRMALAEADSSFFVLLAAWIQIRGLLAGRSRRALLRCLAVGLVSALAFLANYRWGVLLVLQFAGLEALGRRWRRLPLSLAAFAAGLVVPLLVTDLLYGLTILGPLLGQATRPRTYLEDLRHNFGKFEAMGIGLRDPLRLPVFLWKFGGPFLIAGLLAALGGMVAVLRKRGAQGAFLPAGSGARERGVRKMQSEPGGPEGDRPAARFGINGVDIGLQAAILMSALPVLLFLFTPCVFPRCLSAALAPWSLLCGWGFYRLVRASARWASGKRSGGSDADSVARDDRAAVASTSGSRSSGVICLVLGLILLVGQAAAGHALWSQRSAYGEAVAWLRQHGADRCLSSNAYLVQAYGLDATGLPASFPDLVQMAARGWRWVEVDNQIWISGYPDTFRELEKRISPATVFPHPAGGSDSFVWEAPEETVRATVERTRAGGWFRPSEIRIYDLGELTR